MVVEGMFFFDGSPRTLEARSDDEKIIHVSKFRFFRLRMAHNGVPKGSIFLYERTLKDTECPTIQGVNALYPLGVDIPKSLVSFDYESGRVGSLIPARNVSTSYYLQKPLPRDLWVVVFADRVVLDDTDTLVTYYDFYDDRGLLLDTLILPTD